MSMSWIVIAIIALAFGVLLYGLRRPMTIKSKLLAFGLGVGVHAPSSFGGRCQASEKSVYSWASTNRFCASDSSLL